MTEQYPTIPRSPESQFDKFEVIPLHEQTLQLPKGQVLYTLDETRAQAFNGEIITELVLPSTVAQGSDIDKRIALMDFGEAAVTEGKAIMFNPSSQKELRNLGVTRSRFALVTMNYHPDDRMVGFLPLKVGESETIGRRETDRSNFLLGLIDDSSQELSRDHVTILAGEDGSITIEDHSKNGTEVIVPKL